jgi:hypothetical protein
MKNTGNELENTLLKITKDCLLNYSIENNIEFNKEIANNYFKKTYFDKFNEIIDKVNKDTKQSDFFNQIETGYYSPIVKQVFQTSMIYECLKYAKEIINNSKI